MGLGRHGETQVGVASIGRSYPTARMCPSVSIRKLLDLGISEAVATPPKCREVPQRHQDQNSLLTTRSVRPADIKMDPGQTYPPTGHSLGAYGHVVGRDVEPGAGHGLLTPIPRSSVVPRAKAPGPPSTGSCAT